MEVLPNVFLSLLSLSSYSNLFARSYVCGKCLRTHGKFRRPSSVNAPRRTRVGLVIFPLANGNITRCSGLSVPFGKDNSTCKALRVKDCRFLTYGGSIGVLRSTNSTTAIHLHIPARRKGVATRRKCTCSSSIANAIVASSALRIAYRDGLVIRQVIFGVAIAGAKVLRCAKVATRLSNIAADQCMHAERGKDNFTALPFAISPRGRGFFQGRILIFNVGAKIDGIVHLRLSKSVPISTSLSLDSIFGSFATSNVDISVAIHMSPSLRATSTSVRS